MAAAQSIIITPANYPHARPGGEQLQVDLKGSLFHTTIMPLAGTVMVVNIGPSEAKVRGMIEQGLAVKSA